MGSFCGDLHVNLIFQDSNTYKMEPLRAISLSNWQANMNRLFSSLNILNIEDISLHCYQELSSLDAVRLEAITSLHNFPSP